MKWAGYHLLKTVNPPIIKRDKMEIKASGLEAYMREHELDKIAVEVVNQQVPGIFPIQDSRNLAKRLIIMSATNREYNGYDVGYMHVEYVMYNSFKKSRCYLPNDFDLIVLEGEEGNKILQEYEDLTNGLDTAFREAFNLIHPQIQEKLNAASILIKEAEELSREHNIPFRPKKQLAGFKMSFYPNSVYEKYGEVLGNDFISGITGAFPGGGDDDGWQSSQAC